MHQQPRAMEQPLARKTASRSGQRSGVAGRIVSRGCLAGIWSLVGGLLLLLCRCRGGHGSIRIPDVADIEPRPIGAMVDRYVVAAFDHGARGILDRVRAADPSHVATHV